ncbi:YfdX family protein [Aureimonas sp. D3]|uniref:YfdX family protein n=1 Tax=Aureimonas sp. D3 TaxID=1638164 RepID=UPI0007829C6A|nr:YfdX family protein [Aureimonas sp. D3]
MKAYQIVAAVLLASTAVGGAYAADQAAKAEPAAVVAAEKTADKDVGKLSADGAQAFRDMHDARLAIFNADPKDAKTLIAKAEKAIDKAKTDDAVFWKAENKLDAKLNQIAEKTKGSAKTATDDVTQEVAWLPIDGQLVLGEDFVATPEKAAAIKKANESVQKGDRKAALETLKLADVNVGFSMAVLPLDKTAHDIGEAAKLIDGGKFYEANALLKGTEERIRFDVLDVNAVPVAHQAKATTADTKETTSSTVATTTK